MRRRQTSVPALSVNELWSQSLLCTDPEWLDIRGALGAREADERACWEQCGVGAGACQHDSFIAVEAQAWLNWPGRDVWLRAHPVGAVEREGRIDGVA